MNPVFCEACGQVHDAATKELELAHGEIERLAQEIVEAERELRAKRSNITRLENELARQQERDPSWLEAKAVFEHWINAFGKRSTTEFDDTRRKAVLARLNGGEFTVDDLKLAINGAASYPFVVKQGRSATGTANQRHDDLELICRNSKNVNRFMALAGHETPSAPANLKTVKPAEHEWPLYRAVGVLRREWGQDTCTAEPRVAADGWPLLPLTFHSYCPLHPFSRVGLVLTADEFAAEPKFLCEGACDTAEIHAAVGALEREQTERALALQAFEETSNPQTLERVVKALRIRGERVNGFELKRAGGIHDNDQLGLLDEAA